MFKKKVEWGELKTMHFAVGQYLWKCHPHSIKFYKCLSTAEYFLENKLVNFERVLNVHRDGPKGWSA